MSKLIDIWAKLLISSLYVVWTKARLHFMRVKWYIEDELHIMKPSKPQVHHKNAHKSNSSQRIDTPDLGTPIIQRENGFI